MPKRCMHDIVYEVAKILVEAKECVPISYIYLRLGGLSFQATKRYMKLVEALGMAKVVAGEDGRSLYCATSRARKYMELYSSLLQFLESSRKH